MPDIIPEKVEIAIAGGSIGGLCAGNVLAASGRDVHILELRLPPAGGWQTTE